MSPVVTKSRLLTAMLAIGLAGASVVQAQSAPVNTSRSNIKRPGMTDVPDAAKPPPATLDRRGIGIYLIGALRTPDECARDGGKVVSSAGEQQCELSDATPPEVLARWTPVVPRPRDPAR